MFEIDQEAARYIELNSGSVVIDLELEPSSGG